MHILWIPAFLSCAPDVRIASEYPVFSTNEASVSFSRLLSLSSPDIRIQSHRAARTRTALPRPAAAGGLVLRRVPGASCPADAGIPAVCAGARPAAGRDVPGVSRRQLCAGGGADGNEQTGEQGSQKIGIKKSDAQLFKAVRLFLYS